MVKQHIVSDTSKKIGIVDFEKVCNYDQLIGKPVPFDFNSPSHPESAVHPLEPNHVTAWHVSHLV